MSSWRSGRTSSAGPASASAYQSGARVGYMPDSPCRSRSPPIVVAPVEGNLRDWEGFSSSQRLAASYAANARDAAGRLRGDVSPLRGTTVRVTRREGSPSAAVLAPAMDAAHQATKHGPARLAPGGRPGPAGLTQSPRVGAAGQAADRPQYVVDHQTYLEYRRKEYARRLQAEQKGEPYRPRSYGDTFMQHLPGGAHFDPNVTSLNFEGRAQRDLAPQMVGSKEEIAWLHPPQIPPPLSWNGYWDLCPGHELLLQLMAVSGVTPTNSPSLVEHFMYKELLSCVQRMQYGAYLIHYQKGEPPHERYFYLKSLPLANRAQYCPFLCWATHRSAHNAVDCIPLCNVMWVTPGLDTPVLKKYAVGDGEHIKGPFVGKKKVQMLAYGAFAVWVFDGRRTRVIELLATDPLAYTMWMKVLEDTAQLNAALDTSGSVRALQRQLEELRVAGELDRAVMGDTGKKEGLLDRYFGKQVSDRP